MLRNIVLYKYSCVSYWVQMDPEMTEQWTVMSVPSLYMPTPVISLFYVFHDGMPSAAEQ